MKKVEMSFIAFDAQDVITTSGFYATADFVTGFSTATQLGETSNTLVITPDVTGKEYYVFGNATKAGSEGAFEYSLNVTGFDKKPEGKEEVDLTNILSWLSSNAQ